MLKVVCTIPLIQVGETIFENVEVTINESSQIRIEMNLFKRTAQHMRRAVAQAEKTTGETKFKKNSKLER